MVLCLATLPILMTLKSLLEVSLDPGIGIPKAFLGVRNRTKICLPSLQEVIEDLGPTEYVVGSHSSLLATALQEGNEGLGHVLATSKRGNTRPL
jgi:hypothetical protein